MHKSWRDIDFNSCGMRPGCVLKLGLRRQVIDLVQKVSDMRYKLGGGKDEGITIPKVQDGVWVPQVSSPDVSEPTATCSANPNTIT